MSIRRATPWIALALILLGMVLASLRWMKREGDLIGKGDTLWRVTYQAKFTAARPGAKLRLTIPADTAKARVYHEDVQYSGLSAERLRSSKTFARELSLVASRKGPHTLTARFDIHISPRGPWEKQSAPGPLTPREVEQYLKISTTMPAEDNLAARVVKDLRTPDASGEAMVMRIYSWCATEIRAGADITDAAVAIRAQSATPLGRARAMVLLCRTARIPARIVTGFRIDKTRELTPQYWVEVWLNEKWVPFDPTHQLNGALPASMVPVRRDSVEIVRGSDMAELETKFTIISLPPGAGASRIGRGHWTVIFDLTRLPLEMHPILALLLLMPLGALVTAIFRTLVGIPTFGTFTPALLALAFANADLATGLLTFASVITIGLLSRTLLDRLKLLMVPRLSTILTLVVLCIVLIVSVLDFFDLTPSVRAVILPMVILTMTIERFYLTAEEDNTRVAVGLLIRTLLVGACCYGVLRWQSVGQLVLRYPELHLITIALLILMGRYSGYRLNELWRFRDLARRQEKPS